jgi:hypothetical protein
MRARLAILLAGTVALGGCAYGYGDYGPYGGLSVGLGYGSGYGGYYDGYYGGYGYGAYPYGPYGSYTNNLGYPYYGWYGDSYYPGTGIYVYDSYRRPHVWNDRQRRYWTDRRDRTLSTERTRNPQASERTVIREKGSGFDRTNRTEIRRDSDRPRKSDDRRPQ